MVETCESLNVRFVPEEQRQCLDEDRVRHAERELSVLPEIVERVELHKGIDGGNPRFPPGGGERIQLGLEMKPDLLPGHALGLVKMLSHSGLLESQEVGRPGGPTHDLVGLEAHLHEVVDSPLEGPWPMAWSWNSEKTISI